MFCIFVVRAIYVFKNVMLFLCIFLIINSLSISGGCCVSIEFLLKLCLSYSETFELSSRCADALCLFFTTYYVKPIVLAVKIVCRMVPLNTFSMMKSLANDPFVLLIVYSNEMLEMKFCVALCLSVPGYLLIGFSLHYRFYLNMFGDLCVFKYKLKYCVILEIILNICLCLIHFRFDILILSSFSLNARVML